MKTLVSAIQKGGQGKTCIVCNLAFDFAERRKLRTLVIDLDTQANASFTLDSAKCDISASQLFRDPEKLSQYFENRDNSGLTLIVADPELSDLDKTDALHTAQALSEAIQVLDPFFDVCLIDTPPSLSVAMSAAVLVSGWMVSPVEMEAYSIQGMSKMVAILENLREINRNLEFLGMLPNKVDTRKPRHRLNLEILQESHSDLLLPLTIGSRDSIAEALGEQMPVWKIKRTAARKATKEIRAVADYVFEKMELNNGNQ